jgi:hypothetical protein
MVDGIRSLFLEEAKELVGHDVKLVVVKGGIESEEEAHVDSCSWVSRQGPSLVTEKGDFPIDHVTSWYIAA